jgi:pyruvate dehydrogenase E2 component (dihydrolipoamide acetyltransferase)
MPLLLFPDVSKHADSATLRRWLVQIGSPLTSGQQLAEFETEDGNIIVEASTAGRLAELLLRAGQTVSVGAKMARVEGVDGSETMPVGGRDFEEKREADVSDRDVAGGGKVIPILMPQAGNTMEEGTVIAWHVKEGDSIAIGQAICEIETDKATMEFESPDAGRLARIIAQVGEPVAVKHIIALLADSDADADSYLASQHSAEKASAPTAAQVTAPTAENGTHRRRTVAPVPMTPEGRVKASPAARKLAAERGITLATIGSGSGPGGRILSSDLSHADALTRSDVANGSMGETRRPLSKMRRAIGLNLQQSKQTVPHFYVRTTINADPLLAFCREQKPVANCTLNDVIVLAVGRAVREFPAVRSQIIEADIIEYPHVNIGIAVGTDEGLVVPVALCVDAMSLSELAAESKRIVDLARGGRLENIGKGHFTISNLGMFGVEEFSAIINPPESGILAVSAAREAVIVENGSMRAGHQMTMTLSADHRIVDGVMAAKFMQRLQAILEHPAEELA